MSKRCVEVNVIVMRAVVNVMIAVKGDVVGAERHGSFTARQLLHACLFSLEMLLVLS
jgi:hypothetical protein